MGIFGLVDSFVKIAVKQNAILKNRIKLIRAMIDSLDELPEGEVRDFFTSIVEEIRKDKAGHFLSLSLNDSNIISYSIREKDKDNENKRVKTSLGRYLSRNFRLPFENNVLNDYVNAVLAKLKSTDELDSMISSISDNDIVDFYSTNRDSEECDSAGYKGLNSCMTGEKALFTQLYALNSDKVQLITFGNRARALLWTTDDGTKVLDRYYPASSKSGEYLREWASRNGYVLRSNPDAKVVDGNVELSDGQEHIVTLKHNDIFPYLDTFKFGEFIDDDKIALSNYVNFGDIVLTETNGKYKTVGKCTKCGESTRKDKIMYKDSPYCSSCFYSTFSVCNICGENFPNNEINYAHDNSYCEKCFEQNFFHCDYCGESDNLDNSTRVDDRRYYCQDCLSSADVEQCKHCGEYYSLRKRNEVYDLSGNLAYVCNEDLELTHRCYECGKYYLYKLTNNKCKDCN